MILKNNVRTILSLLLVTAVLFLSLTACTAGEKEAAVTETSELSSEQTTKVKTETETEAESKSVTETPEESETVTQTAEAEKKAELPEYYGKVIGQYKEAVKNNYYSDLVGEEAEKAMGKYVTLEALASAQDEKTDGKFYYALYDVDKNGVPELFISTKDNEGYILHNIISKSDKGVYPLFGEYFGMTDNWACSNGTFVSYTSDETTKTWTFRKFDDNGEKLIISDTLKIENYPDEENIRYTLLNYNPADEESCAKAEQSGNYATDIGEEKFMQLFEKYTGGVPESDPLADIHDTSDISYDWKEIK